MKKFMIYFQYICSATLVACGIAQIVGKASISPKTAGWGILLFGLSAGLWALKEQLK